MANYPRNSLESFETTVQVEELPMSVLLTRGWHEEVVRRFPSVHSEAHGCELYSAVPVRTCTWGEAYQSCEQIILEREKTMPPSGCAGIVAVIAWMTSFQGTWPQREGNVNRHQRRNAGGNEPN